MDHHSPVWCSFRQTDTSQKKHIYGIYIQNDAIPRAAQLFTHLHIRYNRPSSQKNRTIERKQQQQNCIPVIVSAGEDEKKNNRRLLFFLLHFFHYYDFAVWFLCWYRRYCFGYLLSMLITRIDTYNFQK